MPWCDEHEDSQMAYCGILNVRAVTKSTDVKYLSKYTVIVSSRCPGD